MSESMVERVARALFNHAVYGIPGANWDAEDDEIRSHYLDAARAAIEAMREPTIMMLMAAHRIDSGNNALIEIDDLRDAWERMIDRSLDEALK